MNLKDELGSLLSYSVSRSPFSRLVGFGGALAFGYGRGKGIGIGDDVIARL